MTDYKLLMKYLYLKRIFFVFNFDFILINATYFYIKIFKNYFNEFDNFIINCLIIFE
jgi:hypothetical protein